MVIIYTTCKDTAEATKIGKVILDSKLASCVNIWPIQSMFHWEGKLANQLEAGMLVKTVEHHTAEIEELITKNHSYSVPFIGVMQVHRHNRAYREWMSSVVKP
ncbi:MAG: divalent-cation tolerance protein CutA [Candidatus Liptonbacteria bacterium]|nr:divalent-cation tolerance protein CutA [Candidatus Liptonbacteria bacterium]